MSEKNKEEVLYTINKEQLEEIKSKDWIYNYQFEEFLLSNNSMQSFENFFKRDPLLGIRYCEQSARYKVNKTAK
jgi:hypothetical protein